MTRLQQKNMAIRIVAPLVLLGCLFFNSTRSAAQQARRGKAKVDTFHIANDLINQKKFRKAEHLLTQYQQHHPSDFNATWLRARSELFLNNFRKADALYRQALKQAPANDNLELDYIHALIDMGKNTQALVHLVKMQSAGKSYGEMYYLYAQLGFWDSNPRSARAYADRALQSPDPKPEWNALSNDIARALAPRLSLSSSYMTDNQPLTTLTTSLRYDQYFSRFLSLYVKCDEYHFLQDKASDAPSFSVGDKLSFPSLGMQITGGVGVFRYPVKNDVSWTGHLDITQRLSPQFSLSLSGDHVPYLDSKTSVDTNISAGNTSLALNWHKRSWIGQAAVTNSLYNSSDYVYTAYAWILAPILQFHSGLIQAGYSGSFSNSSVNSYVAVNSLDNILLNFTPGQSINGIYSPYFTPNNQLINTALLACTFHLSNHVSLLLNGDIGYGTIRNPYLYLDKNTSGTIFINKGYSMEHFTPSDATAALQFQIGNSWSVQAKYMYRNTYFFTSSYGYLGIEKCFLPKKKAIAGAHPTSAYMERVKEIEGRIRALSACSSADELTLGVRRIREDITTLRDEQKMLRDHTEIVPGSERARMLEERYDDLDNMLNEIRSVDLSDPDDTKSRPGWLTRKVDELTNIDYQGEYSN